MPRHPGEPRRRIAALLADGGRHDREEIVAVVSSHVPYAEAVRRREDHKRWQRLRKKYLRQQADPDARRLFDIGARQVINEHLQSMVKTGRVERIGNTFRLIDKTVYQPPVRPRPRPVAEGLSTAERSALRDLAKMLSG